MTSRMQKSLQLQYMDPEGCESTEKKRWRQKDGRRNISMMLQSRASFWIIAKKSGTPKFHHVVRNDDKHHDSMSVIITTGTLLSMIILSTTKRILLINPAINKKNTSNHH